MSTPQSGSIQRLVERAETAERALILARADSEKASAEVHKQRERALNAELANEKLTARVKQLEAITFNDLLVSLDAQYKRFCDVRHTSIWGGSFEREHGAAMEIKPIVNKMFDTLIKLMESRAEKQKGRQ